MKRPWKAVVEKGNYVAWSVYIIKSNGEKWGLGESYQTRRAALHAANALTEMVVEELK